VPGIIPNSPKPFVMDDEMRKQIDASPLLITDFEPNKPPRPAKKSQSRGAASRVRNGLASFCRTRARLRL